jgi:hypothetical protein
VSPRSSGVQEHPTGKPVKILEETRARRASFFLEEFRARTSRGQFLILAFVTDT